MSIPKGDVANMPFRRGKGPTTPHWLRISCRRQIVNKYRSKLILPARDKPAPNRFLTRAQSAPVVWNLGGRVGAGRPCNEATRPPRISQTEPPAGIEAAQ